MSDRILYPFDGPYDEGFAGYMARCPGCATFDFQHFVSFHSMRVVPRQDEPWCKDVQ